MSKFTRNIKAIKKLNQRKNNLIKIVAFCNKMIGKNINNSKYFKMKNKFFNRLCKIQDILKLENLLYSSYWK